MITYGEVYITFDNSNNKKIMSVEAGGETFKHVAYQKDAPWTKDLEAYTGAYFCQELKTIYQLSIKDKKLIINNLRTGEVEFAPLLKDTFTGKRRYFNELKFSRNNQKINGFQLSTYTGDKLWFERTPMAIVRQTKVN